MLIRLRKLEYNVGGRAPSVVESLINTTEIVRAEAFNQNQIRIFFKDGKVKDYENKLEDLYPMYYIPLPDCK